jgi:hypothetical protein
MFNRSGSIGMMSTSTGTKTTTSISNLHKSKTKMMTSSSFKGIIQKQSLKIGN